MLWYSTTISHLTKYQIWITEVTTLIGMVSVAITSFQVEREREREREDIRLAL
jgi:hypothetical protein